MFCDIIVRNFGNHDDASIGWCILVQLLSAAFDIGKDV